MARSAMHSRLAECAWHSPSEHRHVMVQAVHNAVSFDSPALGRSPYSIRTVIVTGLLDVDSDTAGIVDRSTRAGFSDL